VKLYVCWGTFRSPRPGGHPCRNAHEALREAGWEPEVERVYGLGMLPGFMNPTRGKIRELTGNDWVPVLVTDDGEVVQDSERIARWAKDNPATASDSPSPARRPG
jgi:Glutathione S-transferase, N-terminal domain